MFWVVDLFVFAVSLCLVWVLVRLCLFCGLFVRLVLLFVLLFRYGGFSIGLFVCVWFGWSFIVCSVCSLGSFGGFLFFGRLCILNAVLTCFLFLFCFYDFLVLLFSGCVVCSLGLGFGFVLLGWLWWVFVGWVFVGLGVCLIVCALWVCCLV